jgi:RNA methyltransferase, TrmH family
VPKNPTETQRTHADSPRGRSGAHAIEHVTSPANETVKLLKSLDRKKSRQESGLFLAEGARLAEAGLTNGWRPAVAIASQTSLERPRTADLMGRMRDAGARVLTTTERNLEAISQKDNPQTVITAFHQRSTPLADLAGDGARRWLALYEVRDPGNLGSIVRSADAAGIDGVILVGTCCDPFSTESVRATMGSIFSVRLSHANPDTFLSWRAAQRAQLVAASMRATDRHDSIRYGDRSIVLMGNEQAGIPEALEDACDTLVRIPMQGDADSLNLSAAAAVMIYEVWRASGFPGARA